MVKTPKTDELHKIMELLAFYQEERGEPMEDLNVDVFTKMLQAAQDPTSVIYGAVTEADGKFTGIIVGMIGASWFARTPRAHIGTLYVHPEYRGGTAAVKLLKGFEAWARDHHIVDMRFEVDSELDAERTYKFVKRLGWRETGRIFEKEL